MFALLITLLSVKFIFTFLFVSGLTWLICAAIGVKFTVELGLGITLAVLVINGVLSNVFEGLRK